MRQAKDLPELTLPPASKLEEYCLSLALHTPEHLSRIAFLEPEDFAAADCRALFLALRDAWSPAELFDREAFRASLVEALLPLYDRLVASEQTVPDLNEPDLAREIETAAHRLRLQRDKMGLARLEVLLRDHEDERTAEDERLLRERVDSLRKRVMNSQKALGARTLLKPHAI
jgi:hypothetical protein